MPRPESAILSPADRKTQIKALKAEVRDIAARRKSILKTRKDLDKQEAKLSNSLLKTESKIAALSVEAKPTQPLVD